MKLTNEQVRALLPHRPPFLLVDEVVDGEPGVRCVAVRTLRDDDWWFAGHFPGNPVMPGVLIVEALAQTATIAAASAGPEAAAGGETHPGGRRGAGRRQGRPVRRHRQGPLQARLQARRHAARSRLRSSPCTALSGRARVKATVDGQLACRGELMFAIVDAAAVAAGEARL